MKKYGEVSFEFLIPHSRKAILHQTLGRGTLSEKCLITDQLEEKTFKGKRFNSSAESGKVSSSIVLNLQLLKFFLAR